MKDTHLKFSPVTVGFHWLLAIGMIMMLAFGLYLDGLEDGPAKWSNINLHKSFGVIILVLAVARIVWRMQNGFPEPLTQAAAWQMTLAKVAHWVLIIGTVAMPVSGILMSLGGGYGVAVFGISVIPKMDEIEILGQIGHAIHGPGGKLLIFFVVLHAAGAFKHQFIDKDGTLSRMLGKKVGE